MAASARGNRERTLEAALRTGIREGRLAAGSRLPSSRDLAAQLGVARGTVTSAYAQLAAEGYVTSRRGSGTSVAKVAGSESNSASRAVSVRSAAPLWDLRPGLPALAAFPRAAWLGALRLGLAELADHDLGYPEPAGLPALRTELAAYLGRVRSVHADPGDLIITHGAAEGFSLLATLLRRSGHQTIAVEDPGHPGQPQLFAEHGLSTTPIPVDDRGLRIDALTAAEVRAVLVTPAHQFPLGVAMAADRRRELVDWARRVNGVILEDDYDAEHRYDRPAIGSIHSLAPAHVVYLGSVSKTLAPALRLGWLVSPAGMGAELARIKLFRDLGTGTLEQAALSQLIRNGGYDRHLRRTRRINRDRRDALAGALATRLSSWRVRGPAAGLHLVVELPAGSDDRLVSAALAEAGVAAPALSSYARGDAGVPVPGLVLGYASMSVDRLRAAVDALAGIVAGLGAAVGTASTAPRGEPTAAPAPDSSQASTVPGPLPAT
ncbi:MocR-like pyridoxine biosynthesis transcription factor PdxR [Actinoalloteichus hymeniacidonis]|nr:PLP-dependent aminotransferase family protein [Actinoalloteichus hymeniacidonis]MBB5910329.1 GntR family transcriptional regulator/MocR family aminotransferase [Actinoalloteichus hymeniacidonis]